MHLIRRRTTNGGSRMDLRGSIEAIVNGVRDGNKRFAAELMSLVEAGRPEGGECLRHLGSRDRKCHKRPGRPVARRGQRGGSRRVGCAHEAMDD